MRLRHHRSVCLRLIEAHGLTGMDAVEMIDHLDRVPFEERPTDLIASVTPEQLILASETEETALICLRMPSTYPLPCL